MRFDHVVAAVRIRVRRVAEIEVLQLGRLPRIKTREHFSLRDRRVIQKLFVRRQNYGAVEASICQTKRPLLAVGIRAAANASRLDNNQHQGFGEDERVDWWEVPENQSPDGALQETAHFLLNRAVDRRKLGFRDSIAGAGR